MVNGTAAEFLNLSETGIAFRSSSKAFSKGESVTLNLFLDKNRSIFEGKGQIAWVKDSGAGGVHVGVQFSTSVLTQDFPKALEYLGSAYRSLETDRIEVEKLPQEYKAFLQDFKAYLVGLKARLDQIEEEVLPLSNEVKYSFKRSVELLISPSAVDQIKAYSAKLDRIASGFDKETKKSAIKLFRAELNPLLSLSPFTQRATLKPRGYAGDYEMMNQIYRDSHEGYSLYTQIIHKYSINENSSESVRYRKGYLKDWFKTLLKNQTSNVLIGNLASGPAREVVEFFAESEAADAKRSTFVLLDQDTEALINSKRNIAQAAIENGLSADVRFYPISVKDVLEKTPSGEAFRELQFDLLYTAGLYDYLNQPIAKVLTIELFRQVKKGGLMIIGNFHPSNPTKTISEFSADWRLIHRTKEQMLDLIPPGFEKSAKIHSDPQGIDLFLEVRKD